ncbi:DUF1294 domain-containing protein [Pararhizobium sp. O133]|uniref:DUF1294 domain-containing protein n=1 Tax=Pararhizobium sp. O133 TaxID=3449278 RepID=UPI003F68814E
MTTALTIVAIILLINIVTFCVFWWDKDAARAGDWRVPESRLLGLALIGGSLGAVAAQKILRHKTRKEPFRTQLLLIVALHAIGLLGWLSAPLWLSYALAR